MGHKFQPALLAPPSYSCSQFPVFSVTFCSTKPPPPPHSHRPDRPRLSPSSLAEPPGLHGASPCWALRRVGKGVRPESRSSYYGAPVNSHWTTSASCSPSFSNLSGTIQLAALMGLIFIFHWCTDDIKCISIGLIVEKLKIKSEM